MHMKNRQRCLFEKKMILLSENGHLCHVQCQTSSQSAVHSLIHLLCETEVGVKLLLANKQNVTL